MMSLISLQIKYLFNKIFLNRSLWQAQTRAGQSVILELPAYPQKDKPFLTVDLAKDIARFNTNLSGVQLNAGSSLNCAMQKITVQESSCIEQSKQLEQLSELTKKKRSNLI